MGSKIFLPQALFVALLFHLSYAFKPSGVCKFPERWEGTWFQSGVRQPIIIEGARLSSKGRCLGSEGDKFIVVDDKGVCFRCVVIHEKHTNVLQYKETYCHGRESIPVLCSLITGDALLYSMFREDALPVPCPFRGPFAFTYNRGHGECKYPASSIDVCTEDSRLLLSYQACPDVYGSESTVEELQCLATWKEGSSRYLVGKVHHNHATSNEDRFRCFVYEKTTPNQQQQLQLSSLGIGMGMGAGMDRSMTTSTTPATMIDYRVAQSGDATCNGLFSATEGSRTMTLKRAPSPNKCRFPNFLSNHQHWHSLDYTTTYSFHHRNSTLRISNTSGLEMKVLCSQTKPNARADDTSVTLLAHFTMGCQSGYVCLVFHRRDSHIIEVQQGQHVRRPEDACLPSYFNRNSASYITLVTSTPEARQCPFSGKFSVKGSNQSQRLSRDSNNIIRNEYGVPNRDRNRSKRVTEQITNCDSSQFSSLVIGCSSTDTMEFRSDCPTFNFISAYSCHGRWEENGTNYIIATPQSRSSHGAKRYCFMYKEDSEKIIHFSSSSDTCERHVKPGVEGNLAFNVTYDGKCSEVNANPKLSNNVGLTILLSFVIKLVTFQIER